jgi:hypothetical protein
MKKAISVLATGALVAGFALALPSGAFAGEWSEWSPCRSRLCVKWNSCSNNCCGGTTLQLHNDATVTNTVVATSNTGGNQIKKSLWTNSITTGEASVLVNIENNVNTNVVNVE